MTTNKCCKKTFVWFPFKKYWLIDLGFPNGSVVKNPPAKKETQKMWVWYLGWKNPLEECMATHSNILAWRILRTEEPGGLQFMGLQRFEHDWSNWSHLLIWLHQISVVCVELSCPTECGILVFWPEIEPVSLKCDCLSTGLPRKSPLCVFYQNFEYLF